MIGLPEVLLLLALVFLFFVPAAAVIAVIWLVRRNKRHVVCERCGSPITGPVEFCTKCGYTLSKP